jgi:hypothetical protein
MGLDFELELEGSQPDWAACAEAARRVGVDELTQADDRFGGQFSRSGTFFGATKRAERRDYGINAEGDHGCSFPVHYSIEFRLNSGKYDESVVDVKEFLTQLSELSPMQFVLSFQYEGVYAIRDHLRGFHFFWDNPLLWPEHPDYVAPKDVGLGKV